MRARRKQPGIEEAVCAAPRATASKRKRNKAEKESLNRDVHLTSLLRMPTEIFMEIACYVFPGDLLNLARCSRDLRNLLMSKSCKRVWGAARSMHGVPQCPSDLSEPQFADLLFGKFCSFCSKRQAKKIFVLLRVKACGTCVQNEIRPISQLDERDLPETMSIFSLCLSAPVGSDRENHCVVRQLNKVRERVLALSSTPEDLNAYIDERHRIISIIGETYVAIERWLRRRERISKRTLAKDRQESILERLRALGYSDDDLDSKFDDKSWKWKQLMNQARQVSDRVWQNIKPQLEKTIQLRREHAGPRFYAERHTRRRLEMTEWLERHRPDLSNIAGEKLFLSGDLLELAIVKELMAEDDGTISMTSERWLLVANAVQDDIEAHSAKIERDFVRKLDAAMNEAMRMADLEENEISVDYEADDDQIPSCLRRATSLFEHNHELTSYAEFLRKRTRDSSGYCLYNHRRPIAWDQEYVESSGNIIVTALRLLEHLGLPNATSMAYMAARGESFKCKRCLQGEDAKVMTWPTLVSHFTHQNEGFNDLLLRNESRDTEVPIINDHDLESEVDGSLVSRSVYSTVDMEPTGENASRYADLKTSWGRWHHGEPYIIDRPDDSEDDLAGQDVGFRADCKLCALLGVKHEERTPNRLRSHMRCKHGTDVDGNLLSDKN